MVNELRNISRLKMIKFCIKMKWAAALFTGVLTTPASVSAETPQTNTVSVSTCIEPLHYGADTLAAASCDVEPVPAVFPDSPDPVPDAAPLSQVVELRSSDGLVSVEGIIRHFDESLITIETTFGVVGVETFGLKCFGAACPDVLRGEPEPVAQDAIISAAAD